MAVQRQDEAMLAYVLFDEPPVLERMASLAPYHQGGVSGSDRGGTWSVELDVPEWGRAIVAFGPGTPSPVGAEMLEYLPRLTASERRAAAEAPHVVVIHVPTEGGTVYGERKRLLVFMDLVMQSGGIVAHDPQSWNTWSRTMLEDEMLHDADVDVSALFLYHAVTDAPDECIWLHTHGLQEIGATDFDIMRPSMGDGTFDGMRALAFMSIEGVLRERDEPIVIGQPGGVVAFLDADDFQRLGVGSETMLRDHDEHHRGPDRVVVCDPPMKRFGLFPMRPRGARYFRRHLESGTVAFSQETTNLIADRARQTFGVFRDLREEFAELQLPCIVKLGMPTRDGSREHMWFEVKDVRDGAVLGELANAPFDVDMQVGDTAWHDLDVLTDWMILSPVGQVQPHELSIARRVREMMPQLKEFMDADQDG